MTAALENSGSDINSTFITLTPREVEQNIARYTMNRLSPLPQVDMKFSSQAHDPVKGNDLVHSALGYNATSWHRELKKFFSVRDTCMVTLTRTTYPN